ncbi:MAG: phosphopantetheine-binding protein [Myxococcales bacterium]|nr:phosphopantetheine-binding protein [Myxococcales bacterium]
MKSLEEEIKGLIVEALMLDDVTPEQIGSDAPLFGDGLGLDSIDALELAIALDRRFGVKIRAEDESTREIFRSVATLAAHVAASTKGGERP